MMLAGYLPISVNVYNRQCLSSCQPSTCKRLKQVLRCANNMSMLNTFLGEFVELADALQHRADVRSSFRALTFRAHPMCQFKCLCLNYLSGNPGQNVLLQLDFRQH